MLGLFSSPDTDARHGAKRWLEVAQNVWNLRRDIIPAKDAQELTARRDALEALVDQKASAQALEQGVKKLDDQLKKTGGAVYPRGALKENVEFFVMAAIVILGFRTYFFGNFEIPTNSMWPTYHGMTADVFHARTEEPNAAIEALRRVAVGAVPYRLDAPVDGEVQIPIGMNDPKHGGYIHYKIVPGRTWFIFPALKKQYTLFVDNEPVRFEVPLDFDFEWVAYEAFLTKGDKYGPDALFANLNARIGAFDYVRRTVDGIDGVACLHTGKVVKQGERVLSFDQESGDKLFVDRISYNFIRPPVGSGIVFRTGNIPMLAREDGDVFFVKRLVGEPGDTLQVKGTTLYRNGAPITGSSAFNANANLLGDYPGYRANESMADGKIVTVEPHTFFAMGDNSPNSKDSRYWGGVPEKDVVGRPVLVYYPFTKRFGLSK